MFTKTQLITLALAAVASAAPAKQEKMPKELHPIVKTPKNLSILAVSDSYTFFQGNGSPEQGWPDQGAWGSFDELWNSFSPVMAQSCGWNGWGADDSADEIAAIRRSIEQVSGETGVDSRFILAIVMQESVGCVRVPTTNNGVVNPGLMQSHNGSGSCAGVNPCPEATILQMIRDGTAGTSSGDGLQQTLGRTSSDLGGVSARAYYAAARLYNSGSVDYNDLNNAFTSTHCYATHVANRLKGWVLAPAGCN